MNNSFLIAFGLYGTFVVILLAVIGWVMNIVTICGMSAGNATGEFIVRIIGIFIAPIGAVAGWF